MTASKMGQKSPFLGAFWGTECSTATISICISAMQNSTIFLTKQRFVRKYAILAKEERVACVGGACCAGLHSTLLRPSIHAVRVGMNNCVRISDLI